MSGQLHDDGDYPYAARPIEVDGADDRPAAAWCIPWRTIRRWIVRSAIVCCALLLFAVVGASIPVYRAARQTSLVADLERRGCVIYWHRDLNDEGVLLKWLRERQGDAWWGEVRDVMVSARYHGELTEDDVQAICLACSKFPKLQWFSISSDHFSCVQIADWPQLDHLRGLSIESSRMSDADLAIIGGMARLDSLTLERPKISGAGIAHLAQATSLEQLTLKSVQWLGYRRRNSQGFRALKSLVVHRSPGIDDNVIICLGPLPQLEEINFNRTPIGDRGVAHLMGSGKVRSLIISEGKVTDSGMATLRQQPAPGWLVLSGMPLTDAGLEALANKPFPTLVLDNTAITDEGFRALARIQSLDYLCLRDTKVTGTGASYLSGGRPLAHLDLAGAPLTSDGITALARLKCSELGLSRTPLDDKGLLLFAESDQITWIDVTQTAITREGVEAFYDARIKRRSSSTTGETCLLVTDYPEIVDSVLGTDPLMGDPGCGGIGVSP